MRISTLTIALTCALTPAAAQTDFKVHDRHPAYAADAFHDRWSATLTGRPTDKLVRTIRVDPKDAPTKPIPGSYPVLSGDLVRPRAQNAPAGSPAPRAALLAPVERAVFKPREQAVCVRHGLKTVWNNQSWRCRRG